MSNTVKVERERITYLKGHFEKVPILPDVTIMVKEN
jgi:3-hydroxymyristoyl/3-hydroxydecanoyl-(acyl carrier protein) dehydratase